MAKYIAGDSVLRLGGKEDQPIQPGEPFEHEFDPDQEQALLDGGAIVKVDEPQAPVKPSVLASVVSDAPSDKDAA